MGVSAVDHPELSQAIEERRARVVRRLGPRDRWSAFALGGSFLAVAFAVSAVLDSQRSPSVLLVALLVAAYAGAFRVQFEVSTGRAVPTQIVLVPMLFLLPLELVPLCVAAGLMLGAVADRARRASHLERAALRLVNSWHAVGPVLVLGLAGEREPTWTDWPLYLGALAAQFTLDFASASARERIALGSWLKPRFVGVAYLVDAALASIGLVLAFVAVDEPRALLLGLPLVGLLAYFARERRARIDHALELSAAYRGTAFLLGDVVEADDAYTGSHSRDVVQLVLDVADELGLDARERRNAEFAALLHDVGKIRIPGEIINKPGPLTPEERKIIETHTVEGEVLLAKVGGLLGEVGRIVRSCHERVDGEGYPDGLAGDEIPLVARIVCACDAFSAMTTDRPYRAARPVDEALAELRRCAGTHFDARVVDAIVRVVQRA